MKLPMQLIYERLAFPIKENAATDRGISSAAYCSLPTAYCSLSIVDNDDDASESCTCKVRHHRRLRASQLPLPSYRQQGRRLPHRQACFRPPSTCRGVSARRFGGGDDNERALSS